jgi:hypothetical protein
LTISAEVLKWNAQPSQMGGGICVFNLLNQNAKRANAGNYRGLA